MRLAVSKGQQQQQKTCSIFNKKRLEQNTGEEEEERETAEGDALTALTADLLHSGNHRAPPVGAGRCLPPPTQDSLSPGVQKWVQG